MLHIIGMILKCIGILLAVILGLIVLLLVIVLFVPIRFEINASFSGKPEDITASAKVTWILHLIRADVKWQKQKLDWRVRAAWKIFDGKEDVKEEVKEVEEAGWNVDEKETKTAKVETPKAESKKIESPKKESEKKPETEEPIEDKVSEKTFLKKIKGEILEIIERIKCTFQKICDKIKEGIDLKEKVVEFLTSKVHRAAFLRVRKELVWLKRFFKVKKGNINLRFGFEDPATTGQALAALSVLYALLNGNVYVEPDFEEKCLEGRVYLKGRLRLIYPTILAIKVVLDKNIRQTYKDIKEFKVHEK